MKEIKKSDFIKLEKKVESLEFELKKLVKFYENHLERLHEKTKRGEDVE